MPIIASPGVSWPGPPASFTDASGHVTATLVPAWCGVSFTLTGMSGMHASISRDGEPVYGGSPAATPGGSGVAFDPFPPLDADVIYTVTADDGTTWTLPVHTAGPLGRDFCWIMPLMDLSASVCVKQAQPNPDWTTRARATLTPVPSSPLMAGTWDVPTQGPQTWGWFPDDAATRARLVAALSMGPVCMRPDPSAGWPPVWMQPGDVTASVTIRRWMLSCELTPITPPVATDLPAWVPGVSYARIAATRGSYGELARTSGQFLDLIGARS